MFHIKYHYYPALSDLNLDGVGQPLTFSSATRGPHGKEWALADEQELIKLLVTLKCPLPVIRPAKTPTYLKRVVKEKWNEVNRLRKRRVRWTIRAPFGESLAPWYYDKYNFD